MEAEKEVTSKLKSRNSTGKQGSQEKWNSHKS